VNECELIEHMDVVSFNDYDDDEDILGGGSLSHRSAFCGMCRLIMLKANNNNNKSNKWLQAVYIGMVIDTVSCLL